MLCSLRIAAALGPLGVVSFLGLTTLLAPPAWAEGAAPTLPRDTPDSLRHFVETLSPARRMKARARQHLADEAGLRRLRPEQRRALRERYESMNRDERRQFRREIRRWRDMKPGERRAMRRRLHHFEALSPEQQRDLVDRKFQGRSPAERQQILERLRRAASASRAARPDRSQGRAFRGGRETHRERSQERSRREGRRP